MGVEWGSFTTSKRQGCKKNFEQNKTICLRVSLWQNLVCRSEEREIDCGYQMNRGKERCAIPRLLSWVLNFRETSSSWAGQGIQRAKGACPSWPCSSPASRSHTRHETTQSSCPHSPKCGSSAGSDFFLGFILPRVHR